MNRIGIYAVNVWQNQNSYIVGLNSVADNKVSVTLYKIKKGTPLREHYLVEIDCDIQDTRIFDYSEVFAEEGKLYSVFINKFEKLSDPVSIRLLDSRDGTSLLQLLGIYNRNAVLKSMAIAGDYCIIVEYPLVTELNHVVKNEQWTPFHLQEFFGAAAQDYLVFDNPKNEYKRKMLTELDPNNCLSSVDSQLDMLSKLVFAMYDKFSVENKTDIEAAFPGLTTYRNSVEATSILNIKSFDNCIKEIEVKNKLRALQKNYYTL